MSTLMALILATVLLVLLAVTVILISMSVTRIHALTEFVRTRWVLSRAIVTKTLPVSSVILK